MRLVAIRTYEFTFTLASRSVGEPALPSCTFMSVADGPLPVLEVGDVRLFSHELDDGLLQAPPAIVSSPDSDLFCKRNGGGVIAKNSGYRLDYDIPGYDDACLKRSVDFISPLSATCRVRTFFSRCTALSPRTRGASIGSQQDRSYLRELWSDRRGSIDSVLGIPRNEYLMGGISRILETILRQVLPDGRPWRTDRLLGNATRYRTTRRDAMRREAGKRERLGSNL